MGSYEMTFEQEVIDRLARIEERVTVSNMMGVDHEDRIRTVEKRQWFLAGVAAVLGSLGGSLMHAVGFPLLTK